MEVSTVIETRKHIGSHVIVSITLKENINTCTGHTFIVEKTKQIKHEAPKDKDKRVCYFRVSLSLSLESTFSAAKR